MELFGFVDPDIDLGNAVSLKIKKLQRRISWSGSIFKRKKILNQNEKQLHEYKNKSDWSLEWFVYTFSYIRNGTLGVIYLYILLIAGEILLISEPH